MWAPCISLLNMFQLLSCELLGLLKMWVFVHWDGLFTELQAIKWWKPWLGGVGFEGWGWVPSFYFSHPCFWSGHLLVLHWANKVSEPGFYLELPDLLLFAFRSGALVNIIVNCAPVKQISVESYLEFILLQWTPEEIDQLFAQSDTRAAVKMEPVFDEK